MSRFDFSSYLSPFTWRYGSEEMRTIFSEKFKFESWRKIWVALAQTQYEAGLLSKKELNDLKKNQNHIETVILRPCNIIGPQIRNTMTQYLSSPYAPVCSDFNPMFQFIHEYDMSRAIVAAIKKLPVGIYNVAPDDVISLKEARKVLQVPNVHLPSFVLEGGVRLLSNAFWSFPRYLIDYIKFASIIDNSAFKARAHPFEFRYRIKEALELLKLD